MVAVNSHSSDSTTIVLLSVAIIALSLFLWFHFKYNSKECNTQLLSRYVDILHNSRKIAVIGCIASGKSTLSLKLCNQNKIKLKYIQLDTVYWKPNWTHPSTIEFQTRLQNTIDDINKDPKYQGYVIDGNFDKQCKDIKWNQIDTVIWLDYKFWIVFYRGIKRTLLRIWNKTSVCNGNIETIPHLFTRNSVPYWVWVCHHKFEKRVATWTKEYPQVRLIRLTSPFECDCLIDRLLLF